MPIIWIIKIFDFFMCKAYASLVLMNVLVYVRWLVVLSPMKRVMMIKDRDRQ